jgi:hypothetical protein
MDSVDLNGGYNCFLLDSTNVALYKEQVLSNDIRG